MHPAYSVIFFTTSAGAGYGLMLLLGLAAPASLVPSDPAFGAMAMGTSLVLVAAGLVSSTFHLKRPERAWRAISQWRSSWLSREGLSALLTFAPALAFAAGWVLWGRTDGTWAWAGWLAAAGAAVTLWCTGRIYSSLKPVPRWHDSLVAPLYLLFGLASGAVLLALLAAIWSGRPGWTAAVAVLAILAAWGVKVRYWRRTDRAAPTVTIEEATGLGALGKVRPLDPPHTEVNYLQREMGFQVARKHAAKLRRLALLLGGLLPAALLALSLALPAGWAAAAALVAAAAMAAGLLCERWLFFAEAQHTVSLYYGREAV